MHLRKRTTLESTLVASRTEHGHSANNQENHLYPTDTQASTQAVE